MHHTQNFTLTAMWPYTYTASYLGFSCVFQLMPKKNTGRPRYEAVKVHSHLTVSVDFVCDALFRAKIVA